MEVLLRKKKKKKKVSPAEEGSATKSLWRSRRKENFETGPEGPELEG